MDEKVSQIKSLAEQVETEVQALKAGRKVSASAAREPDRSTTSSRTSSHGTWSTVAPKRSVSTVWVTFMVASFVARCWSGTSRRPFNRPAPQPGWIRTKTDRGRDNPQA